jgi:hypothetical protein
MWTSGCIGHFVVAIERSQMDAQWFGKVVLLERADSKTGKIQRCAALEIERIENVKWSSADFKTPPVRGQVVILVDSHHKFIPYERMLAAWRQGTWGTLLLSRSRRRNGDEPTDPARAFALSSAMLMITDKALRSEE